MGRLQQVIVNIPGHMVVKVSWDWPMGYEVISQLVFTFDDDEYLSTQVVRCEAPHFSLTMF
jgi:hypothetical protein